MPKFFLTTPIYYVNARPHIGHAYTTLAADTIARRHRLRDDTFFLTGTDEHGQKIERSAQAAGLLPQHFTDEVSASFQTLWQRMGITNDAFIRTTSDAHKRGAQKLFADLHARGQIYLSSYTGQYSIGEEMFVEGPPGTLGPDGKPTETVTEENFFFRLSDYQLQLLNLIESDTLLIRPEARKNEVLSFLRGDLRTAQEPGAPPSAVLSPKVGGSATEPTIAHTALGNPYVPGALRDLSVSRSSFTWGIPVPEPAASETKQPHVIYVWLDALANYMTALGYGSDDPTLFDKFWPADLHLVGKEIIRFHCVYWPAFLLAAGIELPTAVTAHGWLLFDDSKMSKSKGNIVRAETILDAFGEHVYKKQFPDSTKEEQDLFATDVLRYFLLREIPFGQDGSFSFDALITRYNADLVNGYANLLSRVQGLLFQNRSGVVPEAIEPWLCEQNIEAFRADSPKPVHKGTVELIASMQALEAATSDGLQELLIHMVLVNISLHITFVNLYISGNEPWKLATSAEEEHQRRFDEVTYTAAESIRIITALLYPILPTATAKVWQQLGLGDIELSAKNGELTNLQWGGLQPGTKLGPLSPIFPRADKGLAQIMIDMEAAKSAPAPSPLADEKPAAAPEPQDTNHPGAGPRTATLPDPAPGTTVAGSNALTTERTLPDSPTNNFQLTTNNQIAPQIAIDDFTKIDLRVAQIVVAERIPKADKLLRLEVDLGPDFPRRQILSGIAEWYTPEELLGRRIVIIANLAPRKMRGLESHGMLLAASSGDNAKPILTTFGEDIALGSRVR